MVRSDRMEWLVAGSKGVLVSLLALLLAVGLTSCDFFEDDSPPGYELDEREVEGLNDCVRNMLDRLGEIERADVYINALGKSHHLLKLTSAGKKVPGAAGEVLGEVNGVTKFRVYGPTGKESIRGMGRIADTIFDHYAEQIIEFALVECDISLCSLDDPNGVVVRAAMLANGMKTGCPGDEPVGPAVFNYDRTCTEGQSHTGLHAWFFDALSRECKTVITTSYG